MIAGGVTCVLRVPLVKNRRARLSDDEKVAKRGIIITMWVDLRHSRIYQPPGIGTVVSSTEDISPAIPVKLGSAICSFSNI